MRVLTQLCFADTLTNDEENSQELAACEEDLLQATQDPEIAEEARATALDTDLQLLKTKWNKEAAENAEN